jgi:catechol 2,3-dioxygenase-like lactoylglutathione lyase family enzyme
MKFLKIKETCLYVRDLEAAQRFYNGKLGLEVINYAPGKHVFFRAGSSVLLCFNPEDSRRKKTPPAHYGGGKQHFAFEVPEADYADSRSAILSLGIAITDEVEWSNGQKSFYFEDPEGNVLEILPEGAIWD